MIGRNGIWGDGVASQKDRIFADFDLGVEENREFAASAVLACVFEAFL